MTTTEPAVQPLLDVAEQLAEAVQNDGGAYFRPRADVEEITGDCGPVATRAELDDTWRWLMTGDPANRFTAGELPRIAFVDHLRSDGLTSVTAADDLIRGKVDDRHRQELLATTLVKAAYLRTQLDRVVGDFVVVFNAGRTGTAAQPSPEPEPASRLAVVDPWVDASTGL